jgi:outer membrane protein, adhesin transport system
MRLPSRVFVIALAVSLLPVSAAPPRAAKPAKPAPALANPAPAVTAPTSRCTEDDPDLSKSASTPAPAPAEMLDPRQSLQTLIDTTLARSRQVGATKLLAAAARDDMAETEASRWPTVNLTVSEQALHNTVNGRPGSRGGQLTANLSASVTVYDSGRTAKLIAWRKELVEVALLGQRSAEEQLSLMAVNLALERARYLRHLQVYGQYVRKMGCLVDALQYITQADKGRSSELVQAQKNMQQAEMAVAQTQSALRLVEIRMRRLVGEPLPAPVGMAAALSVMPQLDDMMQDIMEAADIAQVTASARAQRNLTESIEAGQRPSVSLTGNAVRLHGLTRANDFGAGVQLTIPLLQPGASSQLGAAAKRYQATLLQREETIDAKRHRLLEMFESGNETLDRARRIVEILRNSERVRAATLQQWQQLGRRSLFDVMASEGDYYSMRVAHVNAMFDAQQLIALIWSMGRGVLTPLR